MKIQLRTKKGSKIRNLNTVPGVLYGKKSESMSVSADAVEFAKKYRENGKTKTFEVTLDGTKHLVYIKAVQSFPLNHHTVSHFDLVKVSKDDTMTAKVRIHFVNHEVVQKKGLIINSVMETVDIEYAVGKGISHVECNIENLEEFDTLKVSDIIPVDGVKILNEAHRVIVSISSPKEEVIVDEDAEPAEEILEVESVKQSNE